MNISTFYTRPKDTGSIINKYLRLIGVEYTNLAIKEFLSKYPLPNSMFSINDALKEWNIESYFFDCTGYNNEKLQDMVCPFITTIQDNNKSQYIIVEKLDKDSVIYITEEGNVLHSTMPIFFQKWERICLIGFPSENSNEFHYKENRRKQLLQKLVLFSKFSFIVLLILYGFSLFKFVITVLLLLKSLGLFISTSLLLQEIDYDSTFSKAICTLGKSNCERVVKSTDSKILGVISWSDLGIFYFGVTGIFLLLSALNLSLLSLRILSWANYMCLVFIPYSIGIQLIKLKSVCLLCLLTLMTFVLEFLLLYNIKFVSELQISQEPTCILLFISVVIVISVSFLKPLLIRSIDFYKIKKKLDFAKFKENIFELMRTEPVPEIIQIDTILNEAIILQYSESYPNSLIIITNPTCIACIDAFHSIQQLLHGLHEINVFLVFQTSKKNKDTGYSIAEHITKLNKTDNDRAVECFNEWNNNKGNIKLEDIYRKYPVNILNENSTIKKHIEWCDMNKIRQTPSYILNSKVLSYEYGIEDVKLLI